MNPLNDEDRDMDRQPSYRSPFQRRSLLKAAGLGLAAASGLTGLSACGEVSGGQGNMQKVDAGLKILPKYKEWPLLVQPDLVGDPPDHPSAYLKYPSPPPQAIKNTPSNKGSYKVYVPNWGPTQPKDSPYFTRMREATGTDIEFVQTDGEAFPEACMQWIQANEFGDAILLFGWMTGGDPNFNETVINRFADLTDVVSGDISERWPLLAGRGDQAWKECVWSRDPNNAKETAGVYAVPWSLGAGPGTGFFYRPDLLAEAGLEVPTTVEEFLDVARAWTDNRAGKWAVGGTDYQTPAWFGLSNSGWIWDGSKLINNNERPEYKEWVEFQRTLTDEKLRHPGIGTADFDSRAAQYAGKVLFDQDGWARWPQLIEQANASKNTDFAISALGLLTTKGRDPVYFAGSGVAGYLFLSKDLDQDGIAEILDVCNYAAAPFGTKEYETIVFGFEGEQFEYDDTGRPARTEAAIKSFQDSFSYTGMSGKTQDFLDGPEQYIRDRFAFDEKVQPYLEGDMFTGLKLTEPTAGHQAGQAFSEKVTDIINGRAELSALDDAIETWKADGGEQSRAFFEKAYKSLDEDR